MSGPNPIVIKFIVEDLNKVQKAMKSIQDVVLGTEKKSTVATRAGASEREKIRAKESATTVQAAVNTANQVVAAQKTGAKKVELLASGHLRILKKQLEDQKKAEGAHLSHNRKIREQHFLAEGKREQAHVDHNRKIREQHFLEAGKREKAHVDYQRKLMEERGKQLNSKEQIALEYNRKLRQQHFDNLHKQEQAAAKKSESQRNKDKSKGSRQAGSLSDQMAAAENRAHWDARRPQVFSPGAAKFSPQAQLQVLRDAKNKSPEEQKAALAKVGALREEAKIARENEAKLTKQKRENIREEAKEKRKVDQAKKEKDRKDAKELRAKEHEEMMTHHRRLAFLRSTGAVIGGVGGIVKSAAAGVFNTVTGLGGGFDVQSALQERVSNERQAHLLSVASKAPGQTPVSAQEVMKTARAASIRTGTDEADIIKGLNAFTAKTGNYRAGAENVDFYSKMAKATGTDLDKVMTTAGSMVVQNEQLGKGKAGDAELKKLMLGAVMQARQGSVEFDDLADYGAQITRTSSSYAGDQAENQRKLLGLSQIGVRTAGKANVAATDLSNIVSDATTHKGDVKELLGKDFKDEKGRFIGGPDQFIGDLMEAAMKKKGGIDNLSNVGADGKRMFGQRSMRFMQALAPVYNAAEATALKGGASKEDAQKAGAAAVRENMKRSIDSQYSEQDLNKDFADVMKSSAEKFESAVRELKTGLVDQLLPVIVELIPVLRALTPILVSLVSFLAKLTGTDIGQRANTGAESLIEVSNAKGDLRTGKMTPDQAKAIQARAGKNIADREAGQKDATGRAFEAIVASFMDLGTLGLAGQTKKLEDSSSELKTIQVQKDAYAELGKAIVNATNELNKVKAPDPNNPNGGGSGGGSPAPAAVPSKPVGRRDGG